MLCQFAVGGDLSAKDIQQRQLSALISNIKHIIPSDSTGVVFVIIKQRAYPGKGLYQRIFARWVFKVPAKGFEQVINFALINGNILWGSVVRDIGGADKAEIIQVRVDENDPFVRVLQQVGMITGPELFATIWLPLTSRTRRLLSILSTSSFTTFIHGPAALTMPLARWACCCPSRFCVVMCQYPPMRRAEVHLVRVRIFAPFSAALRALSTTSRASSTQQSEYSKARRYLSLSGTPASAWRRSRVAVPGNTRLPPRLS